MQTSRKNSVRISSHSLVLTGLVSGLLVLAACQPIPNPAQTGAQPTAAAAEEASATPEATTESGVGAATVTISTSSLRVRALPSDDAEVVAAVKAGDTFTVTGISSDGEWIQVEIEEGPDGLGWVSAEFVTLTGDITSIEVVEVATAEATEEATEEATPEATEEATPEATEEATPEATEEATPEATEEATPEATEEATPEATEEATPEATEEATPEATEEATPEATEEAAEDLGTVTILVDVPLRVRSEPTTEVDNKIGSVYNLEVYTVLEISEDGLWVKIETPQFPEGEGWVSAEFVVFNEAE